MLRSFRFALPVLAWLVLSAPAHAAEARGAAAHAESLYSAGRFADAEQAFQGLPVKGKADTLVGLRRAALHLWRNDLAGARRELDAVDRVVPGLRTSRALRAESWMRQDSCTKAAEFFRVNGRVAKAAQCSSFVARVPYQIEGPDETIVPFLQTDPLPVISIEIGDRGPRLFLIDTGGGDMVLDPVFADSLQIPTFGEENGTFGGGKQKAVRLGRLDRLKIGGMVVRNVPVGELDVSRFGAITGGRALSGIIGTNLFQRFRATLDYPGGRLVLRRRHAATSDTTASSGRIEVPIWLGADHLILARGRLAEGSEALWFVDTGLAGAGITAPASSLEDAHIPLPDTTNAATGQGGGGAVRAKPFGIPSFQLGEARGGPLLGIFGAFPPTLENGQGYRIAGIVSHAFFRMMRVTIDFDRMMLRMERQP